ncbi:hypothetical protein DY000_02004466 [Brassica cretica]|uniref:DET1- and DDB1-associated protein 1 n=1 Tax=Brassica cretica TaxID=69181 RepID=A0ABQ7BYQ0_BRACR|nr:hypothetical protein DY000_02004466 [Brassica cretica]
MELLVTPMTLPLFCSGTTSMWLLQGLWMYGASCKFNHSVPVNPYHYAGLTMPSLPTDYAPPVSTQVRITSPPSSSDSTTVSNGDKSSAENQTSENEKQDDGPVPCPMMQRIQVQRLRMGAMILQHMTTQEKRTHLIILHDHNSEFQRRIQVQGLRKGTVILHQTDNSGEKDSSDNAA